MITFKQFLESKQMQKYYDGDIDLSGMYYDKLPEELKDLIVSGHFYCSNNQLTSLENSPKKVGGSFNCNINQLTTLKGAPKIVGRSFFCSHNQLTSLEYAPEIVKRDFYCNNNGLTTLEGTLKIVKEDFYCYGNPVKFTEKYVRSICTVKGQVVV